jgi:peptidylprolyl isomerase
VVEFYPEKAPEHVKRFKQLADEGFYNGVVFHRVIDGFMAQTGDPTGTGAGGSNLPDLKAEFNDIKHTRGVLSMARSSSPNSANSQFFIVLEDSPHLDGQYTAFGKVVKGMEFVDKIKKGNQNQNGMVVAPDKMIKVHAQ